MNRKRLISKKETTVQEIFVWPKCPACCPKEVNSVVCGKPLNDVRRDPKAPHDTRAYACEKGHTLHARTDSKPLPKRRKYKVSGTAICIYKPELLPDMKCPKCGKPLDASDKNPDAPDNTLAYACDGGHKLHVWTSADRPG